MPRWLDEMTEAVSRLVQAGSTQGRRRQDVTLGAVTMLEPGWYGLATGNRPTDVDSLTDLKLPVRKTALGSSYQVLNLVVEPERLRIQVGAHAPSTGLMLFARRAPNGFLEKSLLDALRALGDPGMAAKLIERRLDTVQSLGAPGPTGELRAQAFHSCLQPRCGLCGGLPGTGKTFLPEPRN